MLLLVIPLLALSTIFVTLPNVQAEIVTVSLDLQTILLDSDEVIPLLNTNNISNMSKVTVSATLPCNSSNVPSLKITGGVLGNTTDIISSSGDYVSLRGPFDTCLFEDTVDISNATVPALNRIFLTNDGISSVLTNLGTTVTITGIFADQIAESNPFPHIPDLYFKFDNADILGTTLDNKGSLGATGDGTIDADVTTGVIGIGDQAFDFEQTGAAEGDYVYLSSGSTLDMLSDETMTINAWVNLESIGTAGGIVEKFTSPDFSGYAFEVESDGKFSFQIRADTSNDLDIDSTTILPTNGTWSMVTVVYTPTDTTPVPADVKLYYNGVEETTTTFTNTFTSGTSASANPVTIGARYNGLSVWMDGQIDEVSIFKDDGLTASEVQQLYNNGDSLDLTP